MRSALYEAASLALGSILVAAVYNHFSKMSLPWIRTAPVISYAADTSASEDFALPEVSVTDSSRPEQTPLYVTMEQAGRLHRDKRATFVDARETERFAAGHISEALHLPFYQPEAWSAILENLSQETMLITYCDDDCDSARRLGEALMRAGYTKVYVMDRGFDSWRNAGFPTAP